MVQLSYVYLRRVNSVNGRYNVFTRFCRSVCVCVCVCVRRRDVIVTMTSLRHQQQRWQWL